MDPIALDGSDWSNAATIDRGPNAVAPRILLGFDASRGAERAVALIRSKAWPAGTRLRVVSSPSGVGSPLATFATRREYRMEYDRVRALLTRAQEDVVAELGQAGLHVDVALLEGHAASAIAAEARRFRADLMILGSRGHGPLRSWLLGSVSAALVRESPCSVLVCREATARRVILVADLASPMDTVTRQWLTGAQVRVLSIARPGFGPAGTTMEWEAVGSPAQGSMAILEGASMVGLTPATVDVVAETDVGGLVAATIAAADDWRADLVVLAAGAVPDSPSNHGIERKFVQSVSASVLVARGSAEALS